ncbi:MAG: hypothetical protein JJT94_10600 [Bernardetiaceae bacterium]|nr:hypothetical protein [Bernardetiaceae bacterium]
MNQLLKKLKDVQSECCVTIIFNTHRTHPDNQKDPVVLNNLIKEAEERLHEVYDKRFASNFVDKLKALADEIDHNLNLEGMVFFVNENIADFVRVPIAVEDRVVIDSTFATRDLVRALHQAQSYYILTISRSKARLLMATADKVDKELANKVFPIENETLYSTDKLQSTMAKGSDNLAEEFFNRVDKAFQEQWKENPMPLVLAGDERNHDHYLKVTDRNKVIASVAKNRDDDKAHEIVKDAWQAAQEAFEKRNKERKEELRKAVSEQKFLSDINDIWRAAREGRGKTLFVQTDYFQAAQVKDDNIKLLDTVNEQVDGYIDDIVDELIEINLEYGGDTVFLSDGELEKFQGIALITRY